MNETCETTLVYIYEICMYVSSRMFISVVTQCTMHVCAVHFSLELECTIIWPHVEFKVRYYKLRWGCYNYNYTWGGPRYFRLEVNVHLHTTYAYKQEQPLIRIIESETLDFLHIYNKNFVHIID
jgi:hypothetical protein